MLVGSIVVGVIVGSIYSIRIEAWRFERPSQLAYRDESGDVIVRRMNPNEPCPEVLVYDYSAVVCGRSDAPNGSPEPFGQISGQELVTVQAAFFWQRIRSTFWYPVRLASVFGVAALAAAITMVSGMALHLMTLRLWVWIRSGR
jgi:hypothetical protein